MIGPPSHRGIKGHREIGMKALQQKAGTLTKEIVAIAVKFTKRPVLAYPKAFTKIVFVLKLRKETFHFGSAV